MQALGHRLCILLNCTTALCYSFITLLDHLDPPPLFSDSTSAFLRGKEDDASLPVEGLGVCWVLVGAFDSVTGEPLFGATAQPFARRDDKP